MVTQTKQRNALLHSRVCHKLESAFLLVFVPLQLSLFRPPLCSSEQNPQQRFRFGFIRPIHSVYAIETTSKELSLPMRLARRLRPPRVSHVACTLHTAARGCLRPWHATTEICEPDWFYAKILARHIFGKAKVADSLATIWFATKVVFSAHICLAKIMESFLCPTFGLPRRWHAKILVLNQSSPTRRHASSSLPCALPHSPPCVVLPTLRCQAHWGLVEKKVVEKFQHLAHIVSIIRFCYFTCH